MEIGKITHSHSQPGGMDRTPPGTPKKGGKMLAVRVQMLDDTITMFQVQAKALGRVLFDQVCNQLHLLESDYFGLEYQETGGTKYWLDLEKPLSRQIGLSLLDTLVRFCVKFYTPDPSQLEEEFTRYLFCLQIKRDLSQGLLQCNNNTAALMASYIVQAECGDYVVEDYPDHRYLSSYKFVPNQDQELERRIMENHKKHAGQSPAEADLNLLETARRCELYGIKMHPAKDHEGVPLNLAVAHMGIVVFQNYSKINTFSWAKIRKISFKRKRFLVKLHPEGYGYYKDTVEFFFEGRNECKNFWKKCVENHGFFRCTMVKKVPRQKTRVLSRGSSFRYSGRTQKQIVDFVRENYVKRQTFQRSQSFRHSSSAHSSVANVGTSISAHPLLPLGDNAVAGTPASLSCGSMTLTSSPVHTADIHAGGSPSPPLTTSVSPGTSVTSSPQHFYPQETPYRRAGHQPTKVKHPRVHSHHAISPLLSPTDAAVAASNRSANLSNNNNNVNNANTNDNGSASDNGKRANVNNNNLVRKDVRSSRNSLQSPEFTDFNEVYSNCYAFLNGSRDNVDKAIGHNGTNPDDEFPSEFLNAPSKSNESFLSSGGKSRFIISGDVEDEEKHTWHRSASCKDLYYEEKEIESDRSWRKKVEVPFQMGVRSPVKHRDRSRRKCYSAVTSKSPSIDRTGDAANGMRIYPSSYPGTTSSLSTDSAEGELEERIIQVLDMKYDSQEEMALSHDDVSHDSYELLERELDDYSEIASRGKSDLIVCESERTRSCSWGSEAGISPMDFRSAENVIGSGYATFSREQNFWSLERGKSSKHKSEIDFRSLSHKGPNGAKFPIKTDASWRTGGKPTEKGGGMVPREFLSHEGRLLDRGWELEPDVFELRNRTGQLEDRYFRPKNIGDLEPCEVVGPDLNLRGQTRENWEISDAFEVRKYPGRRKSLDELAIFPMDPEDCSKGEQIRIEDKRRMEKRREKRDRNERFHEGFNEKEEKEWVRGVDRRPMDRRKSADEKQTRVEEGSTRKILPKTSEYANFQEIQFKKFDRVVSNQFGKYSEFLTQGNAYDFVTEEKKVIENYDKLCQVGKMVKEMKKMKESEGNFAKVSVQRKPPQDAHNVKGPAEVVESEEQLSNVDKPGSTVTPRVIPKPGKALVERTKSDPYNSVKIQKRSILMHQKSIDLTPQQSEETISDYDNEDGLRKTSRSEHDIPYILHKRHCMNGTAKTADFASAKRDFQNAFYCNLEKTKRAEGKPGKSRSEGNKCVHENVVKPAAEEGASSKQKPSSVRVADAKKAGVQIINLDLIGSKSNAVITDGRRVAKTLKSQPTRKPTAVENKTATAKNSIKRDAKKTEFPESAKVVSPGTGKASEDAQKSSKTSSQGREAIEGNVPEPIYAEVCREKIGEEGPSTPEQIIPPEPPKRTTSVSPKPTREGNATDAEKITPETGFPKGKSPVSERGEPQRASTHGDGESPPEAAREENAEKKKNAKLPQSKTEEGKPRKSAEAVKAAAGAAAERRRGKADLPPVLQRREESLILFARTRLGLSEGSAFAPIVRQGRVGSPTGQRRTKSLDSPYVSVHSLPPADSFSSKDDTVDGNEGDVVKEFIKGDSERISHEKSHKNQSAVEPPASTESEADSVFVEDAEMDYDFKKNVENQSKMEVSLPEEKVLDGVRNKRLLSKIESVDFIDSEGDMDSSKQTEPVPIPSDRLVNLPESIRFPSVRQISGQTSEESADGWDQREVKVRRRTPRRSVGREEQDAAAKESVVWDSKDEEPPDDSVWDDSSARARKYEGSVVNVGLPVEYLKRGSCGQSIDDDNLSTPMKESSPEHWVSVDDLPEALEREEKLLRQQEKILREKILNEKLKRELNLDTIDVDERYCDYRESHRRQGRYEEEPMSLKETFKGHSLDTYELNEKKLRERGGNKHSSLDEHLLGEKPMGDRGAPVVDAEDRPSYGEVLNYPEDADYLECKVVNDVAEIDQFGDNDEELEEFFVVLDENLRIGKEGGNGTWEEGSEFGETMPTEDILMTVPEEFKDEEETAGELDENAAPRKVEIRLSKIEGGGDEEKPRENRWDGETEENGLAGQTADWRIGQPESGTGFEAYEIVSADEPRQGAAADVGRLSPYGGSRRGSEERRKTSSSDDVTGRLSPYDNSSRRSSVDPRRLSASDDAGRLSPFDESRRGSEDPRRLSTSEDSRKYSASESVSEETRRRLSSTEETRRKRASLTKQCSVGAESLSDEMISGIRECSSSFEQDEEKDVFEVEPPLETKPDPSSPEVEKEEQSSRIPDSPRGGRFVFNRLEIEVSEDASSGNESATTGTLNREETARANDTTAGHLAPPTSERELSRETEDSVDYGEGDFKDIRDAVEEKDISEGSTRDVEPSKREDRKRPSSSEKSESSECDEFRYIDDKRGGTPEMLVGRSKEAVAASVVVVNEGISVLRKIAEGGGTARGDERARSLPRRKGDAAEASEASRVGDQRHTLPKVSLASKPKPLTPKPVLDSACRKPRGTAAAATVRAGPGPTPAKGGRESGRELSSAMKTSLDSSQESDVDKLCDLSLISHVRSQIARRNLSDAGKCLRRDDPTREAWEKDRAERRTSSEEDGVAFGRGTSSEERERTESSSLELKSSAEDSAVCEGPKWKAAKGEKKPGSKSGLEGNKAKRETPFGPFRDKRSPDQEKRDSGEDGSSSSSAPVYPKRELSSTWKPFLLESSGSSSLEEGWLPADENAHLADEEETSSTSNNQQDDSYREDVDYPTGIGYPALSVSSAEMMVGGYGSVYALSRTLSRISERSTSEQERSDLEEDVTKPSSRSASVEEESMMSSDRQPSLSSDPPSPRESASRIPDLPVDGPSAESPGFAAPDERTSFFEPFGDVVPPPVPEDDWPSPPSSSSVADAPVVSHIETFYIEIHPEEARKVVVAAEPRGEGDDSSSDENQTLQESSEFLHLSSDNVSASTTTTTQDGTVIVSVRPKSGRTGSLSEDASVVSASERSGSATAKHRPSPNFGAADDSSDRTKSSDSLSRFRHPSDDPSDRISVQKQTSSCRGESPSRSTLPCPKHRGPETSPIDRDGQKPRKPAKPLKLASPTGKGLGFFETPVSRVRSPTSQRKFYEPEDEGRACRPGWRSPTSFSETTSPKNRARFFDSPFDQSSHDRRALRSSSAVKAGRPGTCTPYYSNVADSAEKSYFGRYDTGSLERSKIQSSRKCCSYYSVSRTAPNEGDSSNSDGPPAPSPNTIPRASKKTKRRHRVAMDLLIRDGKIVAPPKTEATVLENSDSDRSSPRSFSSREANRKLSDAFLFAISETSADAKENVIISSTPLQNGKINGELGKGDDVELSKSPCLTPLKARLNNSPEESPVRSDGTFHDQNSNESQTKETDPRTTVDNNRNALETCGAETESRKKRHGTDKGYFIIKELLSTERTYKKDLDVINVWFHEEVSKSEEEMPDDVLNGLFNLFDPLSAAHSQFLRELEQRLATWEGKSNALPKRDVQKVGDVILSHFNVLPLYVKYLDKHLLVLERLDAAFRKNRKFEQVYRDFELQRVCYLPLSSFIMKPLQRLLHYNNLLKRLIKHYGPDHVDCKDVCSAQNKLAPIIENVPATLKVSENFIQLSELQRDMPGFEGLLQGGREFIRQGCLLKHSKKGFQQRMFFLFSDILVYTNRTTTPSLQFKVNGQMPLRGVMVEESEDRIGTNFSFTIYGGNRIMTVAASSQEEKEKWLQDLFEAVQNARERNDGKMLQYLSLKSCSSSDEIMDKIGEDGNANRNKNSQQRSNTTVHVCWHRNASTCLQDHLRAFENGLSGFLLRKFKNSNGWQKLWVVFTNFCLFFYKAYLDESPLASLPLLGYTVTIPDDEDDIRKDYVFKLQFKNHVYFFRAESDYTFSRWMEVISSATKNSSRTKHLAYKDNS